MKESFFLNINSDTFANLISETNKCLCYAAPGIQDAVAQDIVKLAQKIGPELILVFLDVDENVLRMGYGSLDAIDLLRTSGIHVQHIAGLRNGLIVSDDIGFSFTPTALFLEQEKRDESVLNAMRLMPDQIKEAMARLSPASKAIAVAKAESKIEIQELENLAVEIQPQELSHYQIYEIQESLKSAPPLQFDVARQVRVFQPHFQYVELSLTGAAIQRHKLNIPKSIQKIGMDKELEGRLKTTFDLIDKNEKVSSKHLDKELREIRDVFTRSLGKKQGRIVRTGAIPRLKESLKELQKSIEEHQKNIEKDLVEILQKSKEMVVNYYLPLVKKNTPRELYGIFGDPSEQDILHWLDIEITKAFPKADDLIQKIELDVNFKDVTYETLNRGDFLESIKEAYPEVDWEKAYEEFRAAGESK